MSFVTAASLFLILAAPVAAGAEIRVSVFGLFHPKRFVIEPVEPAALNGRYVPARTMVIIDAAPARLQGVNGGAVAFRLSVPGRITREFRGRLDVQSDSDVLRAVVSTDLETAVASALAAEMPTGASEEALAAMAVAIRSYYAAGPRHRSFGFCDTTHCQFHRSPPRREHAAARATELTRGLVLTYNGATFAPYYSAACGGRTRSLEEVGLEERGYPYRAVGCSFCERHEPPWRRRIPREFAVMVTARRSEATRLKLVRELGWDALPSNHYQVERQDEELVANGRGRGHGVGICQRGVIALAGAGMEWRGIVEHYLPGAVVHPRGDR